MSANGQTAETIEREAISPTDVEDLKWYFRVGVGRLESGSNFSAMIDRLQFFGIHARPCKKCGGDRTKNTGGSGFVSGDIDYIRRKQITEIVLGRLFPTPEDLTCPACNGKGWLPGRKRPRRPITARPTGSSIQGSGVPDTGGSDDTARLGKVDRHIAQVRLLDRTSHAALEAYFSPAGGKLEALWHLTPSGKTMLHERGSTLTPPREFWRVLKHRQRVDPDEKRRRQFEAADRQAANVHERMVAAWNEVGRRLA